MPSWGITDQANDVPRIFAKSSSNLIANALYQNTTPSACVNNQVVGVYGVSTDEANTKFAHTGWVEVTTGTGGINSVTITATGSSGYANGETVSIANGSSVGIVQITTTAQGNLASGVITNPGSGWVNTSQANVNFNREKHIINLTVGGTPTGYNNTDVLILGNGTINAVGSVLTNSTGGFVTANISFTNQGIWANNKANTDVSVTWQNSSGGASAGTGGTFTANIGWTGTGGSVAVASLGGRAGRVSYETLVAAGSLGTGGGTVP